MPEYLIKFVLFENQFLWPTLVVTAMLFILFKMSKKS